jgi:hypothetical protein
MIENRPSYSLLNSPSSLLAHNHRDYGKKLHLQQTALNRLVRTAP